MTIDQLERLCDECKSPLGVVLKVPGVRTRKDHHRQMVLASVWGLILKECPDERHLIVRVKVADLRRFIARARSRLVPMGQSSSERTTDP